MCRHQSPSRSKRRPILCLLFCADVLCLRSDKRPNLITLTTVNVQPEHILMVIFGGGTAKIAQQVQNRMLCNFRHAASGIDGDAFY